jgi:hypothetical protein
MREVEVANLESASANAEKNNELGEDRSDVEAGRKHACDEDRLFDACARAG